MAVITRVSYGAFHNVFNAANQPSPGTFAIGDTLLIFTGEFMGADVLTTPAGWTLLSPNNNAKQQACFGLISVTGLESMPSMTWGSQFSWAIVGVYRNVANLTVVGSGDRFSNSTSNIIGPAGSVTPPVDGCVVLFFGARNKTAASNASTFTAPSNFVVAAQQTQSGGGSITADVVCEWIQTTATTVPANQAISGSVADATTQSNQGIIVVLQPVTSPPPPTGTQGYVPRPGNPALSSPTNFAQFKTLTAVSQPAPIVAPIAGRLVSNSTIFGSLSKPSPALNVGFVKTPGPGVGPFSNNQFDTFTWATSNPSPTTGLMAGVLVSNSTLYVTPSSTAATMNGVLASSSTCYAELDGLQAGTMSGILVSSSTAYANLGGTLDMSFALLQSNSTLTMLSIGGSFQPLVPFTAVVDVRLNIGYQPWRIHPEGTIG